MYFAGSLIDKISIRVALPLTLLVRAGVYYIVFTIQNPVEESYKFWICCPMMHVCYYFTEVAIKSYLYKIYPEEIRGMCFSAQHIGGVILGSGYPFLIQYFYEIGPRYVFFGVSMIDLGTIVLLLLLYTIGFGKENPNVDDVQDEIEGLKETP